jgi:hypothetical protein
VAPKACSERGRARPAVGDASAPSIKTTTCVLHALSSIALKPELQPLLLSNSLRLHRVRVSRLRRAVAV